MNSCNVVLVSLYRNQNYAIRTIHAVLEGVDGIKPYAIFYKDSVANIAVGTTITEEKLFIQKIIELKPAVVGISVLSPYATVAKRVTRLVRENSSALVVWGGVHATICPDDCIKEADIVCLGEGEGALVDLVKRIRDGEEYLDIQNLWINNGGKVLKNPLRPLIQDLDSIPFQSYGSDSFFFINDNKLMESDPVLLDDRLIISASRGCPYACPFCINSVTKPLFKGLGNYIRRRTVRSLINEMKQQLNFSKVEKRCAIFNDEVFAWDNDWVDEFQLLYKQEIGIPFSVTYNPRLVNPEIFAKLRNAGLVEINMGIQTGSDDVRKNIFNRPEKNCDIIKADKVITGNGVSAIYDLITDNPYETVETLTDTIQFLLQLTKPLHFKCLSLQYFPRYPLTQKATVDGYVRAEDLTEDRLFERSTKDWMYDPKLFPLTKKMMLQNIIWLVIWNHTSDAIVKRAVFGSSFDANVLLLYLNIKAVVLGKIYGKGGIVRKSIQKYQQSKHILSENLQPIS